MGVVGWAKLGGRFYMVLRTSDVFYLVSGEFLKFSLEGLLPLLFV